VIPLSVRVDLREAVVVEEAGVLPVKSVLVLGVPGHLLVYVYEIVAVPALPGLE
jgi:hypothetical protein